MSDVLISDVGLVHVIPDQWEETSLSCFLSMKVKEVLCQGIYGVVGIYDVTCIVADEAAQIPFLK